MKTLDVEALLAKNPRVDREQIKEAKLLEEQAARGLVPRMPPPVSPYAGRRVVVEDKPQGDRGKLSRRPAKYAVV